MPYDVSQEICKSNVGSWAIKLCLVVLVLILVWSPVQPGHIIQWWHPSSDRAQATAGITLTAGRSVFTRPSPVRGTPRQLFILPSYSTIILTHREIGKIQSIFTSHITLALVRNQFNWNGIFSEWVNSVRIEGNWWEDAAWEIAQRRWCIYGVVAGGISVKSWQIL